MNETTTTTIVLINEPHGEKKNNNNDNKCRIYIIYVSYTVILCACERTVRAHARVYTGDADAAAAGRDEALAANVYYYIPVYNIIVYIFINVM